MSNRRLYHQIRATLAPYLDGPTADALERWRQSVFVEPSEDENTVMLKVLVKPARPVDYLTFSFEIEAPPPPEPSVVDRMAALEDREAAWRCIEYDRWAEEKAARESAKMRA